MTVGVDPGADGGLAVVSDAGLVYLEDIRKLGRVDLWRRVKALQRALFAGGVDVSPGGRARDPWRIVVEDQYTTRLAGGRAALVLAAHAAAWETSAQVLGAVLILDRVYPAKWQAMIGGAVGRSKARKDHARAVFVDRWPQWSGARQGAIDAAWVAIHADATRRGWSGNPDHVAPGWSWLVGLRGDGGES